ncbi:MAG: hypothetical protein BWX73_02156 [Lentisphaerae bacterium ADurb.Bin082]|nr:MAG: hypothetical protein BWX73_02156 [Lentisphaerae bacterium ADurb.Bin082]
MLRLADAVVVLGVDQEVIAAAVGRGTITKILQLGLLWRVGFGSTVKIPFAEVFPNAVVRISRSRPEGLSEPKSVEIKYFCREHSGIFLVLHYLDQRLILSEIRAGKQGPQTRKAVVAVVVARSEVGEQRQVAGVIAQGRMVHIAVSLQQRVVELQFRAGAHPEKRDMSIDDRRIERLHGVLAYAQPFGGVKRGIIFVEITRRSVSKQRLPAVMTVGAHGLVFVVTPVGTVVVFAGQAVNELIVNFLRHLLALGIGEERILIDQVPVEKHEGAAIVIDLDNRLGVVMI